MLIKVAYFLESCLVHCSVLKKYLTVHKYCMLMKYILELFLGYHRLEVAMFLFNMKMTFVISKITLKYSE